MTIFISDKQLHDLVSGESNCVELGSFASQASQCVFPGSFNPLHVGHLEMSVCAERLTNRRVVFEISIENVEKAPLSAPIIRKRLEQFEHPQSVVLTRASRFTEKADLFPNAQFVVGADTIVRIGNEAYYDGDKKKRDEAIGKLENRQVRFLVFGRLVQGAYQTVESLSLPSRLRSLCDGVDEDVFRRDISSTELRATESPTTDLRSTDDQDLDP